jgi:glutathione-independent formaldehyde dehydrogenase
VVYKGPGEVAVEDIEYPKLEVPGEVADAMGMTVEAPHAVILRIVSTNVCPADQYMVRGRTTAPVGQTLGHEITGEVVEKGNDVQFINEGDICSVPFNIACGRCRNCNEGKTGVCLNVNPARAGSAYGYVDMGPWQGGQAEYVMVPFADFNLLKFPDRDQALEKILDLTMLSDIFPTGYHGAYTAQVTTGSTVYVAGAGQFGLVAAYSSLLLGAAVVIVGDLNEERLSQARSFGCETVNVAEDAELSDQIAEIVGEPEVDCAVDAVGFEATAHGPDAQEAPATVLNAVQSITRAGGSLGIPGLYVTGDPGASDPEAREGTLKIRFGLGWAKSHAFYTGQCPVMKYNRGLMMNILHDKAHIADAIRPTVITLDEAPEGYKDFDRGMTKKYILNPNGYLSGHNISRPRYEREDERRYPALEIHSRGPENRQADVSYAGVHGFAQSRRVANDAMWLSEHQLRLSTDVGWYYQILDPYRFYIEGSPEGAAEYLNDPEIHNLLRRRQSSKPLFDTTRVPAAPIFGVYGAGVITHDDTEYPAVFIDDNLVGHILPRHTPHPIREHPLTEKIVKQLCGSSQLPVGTMFVGVSAPEPHFGPSGEAVCHDLGTAGTLGALVTTQAGNPGILTAGHVAHVVGRDVHCGTNLVGKVEFTVDPRKARFATDRCSDIAVIKIDDHSNQFELPSLHIGGKAEAKAKDKVVKYCSHPHHPSSYRAPVEITGMANWIMCPLGGMWEDAYLTDTRISDRGDSGAPVLLEGTDLLVGHIVGSSRPFPTYVQTIGSQLRASQCTFR